jgi:hypothetical protein
MMLDWSKNLKHANLRRGLWYPLSCDATVFLRPMNHFAVEAGAASMFENAMYGRLVRWLERSAKHILVY